MQQVWIKDAHNHVIVWANRPVLRTTLQPTVCIPVVNKRSVALIQLLFLFRLRRPVKKLHFISLLIQSTSLKRALSSDSCGQVVSPGMKVGGLQTDRCTWHLQRERGKIFSVTCQPGLSVVLLQKKARHQNRFLGFFKQLKVFLHQLHSF